MSVRNVLAGTPLERGDTLAASIGVALAVLLFPLQFYISQAYLHTVPVLLGAASGLYLALERYQAGTPVHGWRVALNGSYVLRLLVVIGLGCMVFVGAYTGGRTGPFFAVAAVVGTLIFAQIFFLQEDALHPTSILVLIVAFALITRGIALLATPSTIGIDSWVHLYDYAHSIRESGSLSAIADSKYFAAPLYHLLVVVAADVFGSSLQTALYVTLGIVVPFSVLLIYSTANYLVPVRWALFAAAAFGVADHFVRWGIHIIPTSMGLVFFIGVAYGVTRIYATGGDPVTYALVLFFGVATILTHQISTFIMLVFLGAGAASQLYSRFFSPRLPFKLRDESGNSVNFTGLFAFLAPLTLVNWHFGRPGGESFLLGAADPSRFGTIEFLGIASASPVESEAVASMSLSIPMSVQLLDALGFLLLLFTAVVGVFTLLRFQHRQVLSLTWIVAVALMLIVTLGLPVLGLDFFVPGRWFAFMYVPMVLLGAYGMSHLELRMPTRQLVVVMVIFALLFPGAMLIDRKATHDNPIADDYHQRFAFTEAELAAAETISEIHPEGETIRTDQPYYMFYRDAHAETARPLVVEEDGTIAGDHVVYRSYQTEGVPKVDYRGESIRVQPLSRDQVCKPTMNIVFSNGDVLYCH